MSNTVFQPDRCAILERKDFPRLIEALSAKGYRVVGPMVHDGAIVYDELQSADNLPAGWTDEQDGGSYRLKRRSDAALFGHVVGPHSLKKFLHQPETRLWRAGHSAGRMEVLPEDETPSKLAFVGVRSCDLHAMAILDKVLMGGDYVDPGYQRSRQQVFVVAVNCGQPGGTCFCSSMNTGPRATFGFDLALTEVIQNGTHHFVVEVGTERGAQVLSEVPHRPARDKERQTAVSLVARAADQMGRTLDTAGIKELLYRNHEHPRWDDVAARCLTCANCTMVCPTCFCSTVEEVTDLTGRQVERRQKWDSCFTMDFSYIHGGSVRASAKSRYRQWLTHKLATWLDQFGTSGCVGCGRCITWCPVGIDITEEVRAIRQSDGATLAKE